MSKKFTMTLLSSSLAGLLVMSGGVSAKNGTYSVLQDDSPKSGQAGQAKYGSTYEVVKTGGNGNFRYEVKEKNDKKRSLFTFDSKGNVTVKGKGITHTLHDPALKDFAKAVEEGKTAHKLINSDVRGVYNKVYGLEKTEITGFSVEDGENGKVSLGSDAKVSGKFSVAVGNGAKATEKASTSVGSWSAALGQQSVALGVGAYAYANASTAAGTAAYVDGSAIYGTAIGNYAKVDKNATEGTALGAKATVTNKNSVALGAKATVTNKNSVALGANSRTTRDNEVYIGYEAEPGKAYKTRVLGGLSDGTRPSDAATVRQVDRVKDSVEQLAQDTNTRLVVEAKKSREYTDSRTTVGVNPDGTLTRAEGASKTLAVNDGLVALSGRTDRIDAAVGSVDRRVTKNTQAIQSNTRQLQEHNARLNSQQRQIRENHEEMKRAAAQSAALAGLFQPYSVGKFNATAALGGYSDKQAVAVGVGYRFNEQTAAKAGIAASDGDVSYNMGVNFEF
ncbi:YadA-like family protein [Escherichia coli]|uniref:YadA-like family protein n=1 Tax=Escherichia coli TaxID=562 RepID=UPI002341FF82|nr:YadA-like family protein [Escherichia coli]MDC3473106.1 YadA-like family protein [Escherichia coli]